MRNLNIAIFCKLPSLMQSMGLVIAGVLLIDFIKDGDLDNLFVIPNLSIHTYVTHTIFINIIYETFIVLSQVLIHSISALYLSFTNFYAACLSTILVSVLISFNIINNKKLISLFSTLHIDTSFRYHKEVINAFLSIP